jgi:hypothetical protein
LTEAVHLRLHLWHGKVWTTGLKDPHMAYKELSGIGVDIRIGASNGDLTCQSVATS